MLKYQGLTENKDLSKASAEVCPGYQLPSKSLWVEREGDFLHRMCRPSTGAAPSSGPHFLCALGLVLGGRSHRDSLKNNATLCSLQGHMSGAHSRGDAKHSLHSHHADFFKMPNRWHKLRKQSQYTSEKATVCAIYKNHRICALDI